MNTTHAARLYFLFALALLVLGWKMTRTASEQLQKVEAAHTAAIDRVLTAAE